MSRLIKKILFANIFLFLTSCGFYSPGDLIHEGRVVLEEQHLQEGAVIPLVGKWFFYPNEFLVDEKSHLYTESSQTPLLMETPGDWTDGNNSEKRKFPADMYGTYMLHILHPHVHEGFYQKIAVMPGHFFSAYSLYYYLPGETSAVLLYRSGIPGKSEEEMLPYESSRLVNIPDVPEFYLLIQVSNFHVAKGGMLATTFLGRPKTIRSFMLLNQSATYAFTGALFIIGFYHLFIFVLRRSDRAALWLSIFSTLMGIWVASEDHLFQGIVYHPSAFYLSRRLHYISYYMGVSTFIGYVNNVMQRKFPSIFYFGFFTISILLVMGVLTLPVRVFTITMPYFDKLTLFAIIYGYYHFTRFVLLKKDPISVFLMVPVSYLLILVASELLLFRTSILMNLFLTSGMLLFVFFQATWIAFRYEDARNSVEFLNNNLKTKVNRLVRELKNTITELNYQSRMMKSELNVAGDTQKKILARLPYTGPFIYVDGHLIYMNKVGGDFYDILRTPRGDVVVILADVSGHGIPAALVTAMAKIGFIDSFQKHVTPKNVFFDMNQKILKTVKKQEYLTALALVIQPDGRVIYGNTSHQQPYVLRNGSSTIETWESTGGVFIGMLDNEFQDYDEREQYLQPGDNILLYTDGIVEQTNSSGTPFGYERLQQLFLKCIDLPAIMRKSYILEEWNNFRKSTPIRDDSTFLILEFKEGMVRE